MISLQIYTISYRIKGGGGSPPSPPQKKKFFFQWQILPQQTIYRWKGNLIASRIHFKYWKNILICDFMSSFREMTLQLLQNGCPKKFQTYTVITYYMSFLSTWSGDSVNINCFAKYLNFVGKYEQNRFHEIS